MKHPLLAFALAAALLPIPALAKLYKWVDANGKVHYSDKVPPEAVSRGHEEKTDTGLTVKTVDAAKSKEQLEAERRAKAEAEAQQRAEQEAKRKQAEQDRILLLTFSNEKEIERSRDDRLGALDGRIQLTQERIGKLSEQLEQARAQAAQAERSGRGTLQQMHARIDTLRQQIADYEDFIRARQQERAGIADKFNADLVRFRELMVEKAAQKQ
jgi:hypothetical protein